jgi:hypothetical protein
VRVDGLLGARDAGLLAEVVRAQLAEVCFFVFVFWVWLMVCGCVCALTVILFDFVIFND